MNYIHLTLLAQNLDSVDTLLGRSFSVDVDNSGEFLLNGNATFTKGYGITFVDIEAKNGTTHFLNQLMLPS